MIHLEAVDDKEVTNVIDATAAAQESTPSRGWGGNDRPYCESV